MIDLEAIRARAMNGVISTACIAKDRDELLAYVDELRSRLENAEMDLRKAMGERDRVWLARLADVESRLNLADAEVTMLRHFNAEADALRKDAERYRWLRIPENGVSVTIPDADDDTWYEYDSLRLDDAIDAAKAQHCQLSGADGETNVREPACVTDKGPWKSYADKDGKLFVMSGDFTHDVVLYVNGDFADEFQRADYCQWLAHRLNAYDRLAAECAALRKASIPPWEQHG